MRTHRGTVSEVLLHAAGHGEGRCSACCTSVAFRACIFECDRYLTKVSECECLRLCLARAPDLYWAAGYRSCRAVCLHGTRLCMHVVSCMTVPQDLPAAAGCLLYAADEPGQHQFHAAGTFVALPGQACVARSRSKCAHVHVTKA